MNTFKLLLRTAFCLLLGGAAPLVVADESDLIYGRGVHAFFDRDYEGTVTILLQAVEIKSIDPRPYYFLGLALLRQGKAEEADQYFRQAAQWEYSGRALRDYNVAEALRRIQGEDRLRIENIRTEERTNARMREQQQREARYGSENAAGRDALRQLAPPNQRAQDLAVLQGMAANSGNNAFGVGAMNPIGTADRIVAQRGSVNPFGDVVAATDEQPAPVELIVPMVRTPPRTAATPSTSPTARPGSAERGEVTGGDRESGPAGTMMSPPQSAREAARDIGRGLGSVFSRRASE